MADDTFRITDQNREAALRVAIAIANLKDLDATVPARLQRLEQDYTTARRRLEQSAEAERQKRLEAVRAATQALIGEHGPNEFVSIANDAQSYTVHRQGDQLGKAPERPKKKRSKRPRPVKAAARAKKG